MEQKSHNFTNVIVSFLADGIKYSDSNWKWVFCYAVTKCEVKIVEALKLEADTEYGHSPTYDHLKMAIHFE